VREEAAVLDAAAAAPLPLARAAVLEAPRLWPTTPMVLRQTAAATTWERGVIPEGTGVLIFAPELLAPLPPGRMNRPNRRRGSLPGKAGQPFRSSRGLTP
jgi:hypothetical protein